MIPEFHLFHRVLKTVCFQWGFRLIHSVCKVSLLSSHLHTVSSFCTCSLAMDCIAWLVFLSSKVSEFQPSANCLKPVKINIAEIVVKNLNTSVNTLSEYLKYCISFCDAQRNRWQESNLCVPFSHTYMSYNNGFITPAFCNLSICHCILPWCPAFCCCWLASLLFFCNSVPFFFLNEFFYHSVIKVLLNFPVVH